MKFQATSSAGTYWYGWELNQLFLSTIGSDSIQRGQLIRKLHSQYGWLFMQVRIREKDTVLEREKEQTNVARLWKKAHQPLFSAIHITYVPSANNSKKHILDLDRLKIVIAVMVHAFIFLWTSVCKWIMDFPSLRTVFLFRGNSSFWHGPELQ